MKKIILAFCFILFFVVANAFADTLILKSGKKIEGKIVQRNNELIKIEIEGVPVPYFLSEIDTVNSEKLTPLPIQPQAVTSPKQETQANVAAGEQKPPINPNNIQPQIPPTVALVILLMVILIYIYSAICLQIIAKKVSKGPGWLAWIPIANLFLMCKVSGLRYWWLLVLLLSFVPIVSIIVYIGFSGFIGYKMALARNKPGWIGALNCIPLVNYIVLGYLAFSA